MPGVPAPAVSSNLARGGEISNGATLLEIRDPRVVSAYAVEAILLLDHCRSRSRQSKTTKTKPLGLRTDDSWAAPFYDANDIKSRERRCSPEAKAENEAHR